MNKKIIGLFIAAGMICSIIPASAEESSVCEINQMRLCDVALNKPVYASSTYDIVETNKSNAVDNYGKGENESYWQAESSDKTPWFMVDLTLPYKVSRIDLQIAPKNSFIISAAKSKEGPWTTLYEQGKSNYKGVDGNGDILAIYPEVIDDWQYIKISRPSGKTGRNFQIYDLSVYAPSANYELENIALGKEVSGVNTDQTANSLTNDNLTDWTASKNEGSSSVAPYFTVDLGDDYANYDVKRVEFYVFGAESSLSSRMGSQRNYLAYAENEDLGEELSADAVKLGEAKYYDDNILSYGCVAFDVDLKEPKRYIKMTQDLVGNGCLIGSEIRVLASKKKDVNPVNIANIAGDKRFIQTTEDSSNLNDGDISSVWQCNGADEILTMNLRGFYNIRKINLEGADSNFEIWGGMSENFENDNEKILLSDGTESDVKVFNMVKYITIKPKKTAVFPVSAAEMEIYAEAGYKNVNASEKAVSDTKEIKDGSNETFVTFEALNETVPVIYMDLKQSKPISAIQFVTGKTDATDAALRNYTIVGSNNANSGYKKIVSAGNPRTPAASNATYITDDVEYRYIGIVKDGTSLSGSCHKGNTLDFADGNSSVSLAELRVFIKEEIKEKPKSDMNVGEVIFRDESGKEIENFTNGEITAETSIENSTESDKEILFLIALFDENNTLVSENSVIYTIGAGKTENISAEIVAENISEGYTLKTFFWDNIENKKPYIMHTTIDGK